MDRNVWRHRWSNLSCGALPLLFVLTLSAGRLVAFRGLSGLGLCLWPVHPVAGFVLAFLALDFLYYWQHRGDHAVGLLWAIHSVHHQSRICDASVSFRLGLLGPLTVALAHLPLALLGLPFSVYLAAYLTHTALVALMHSRLPRWMDGVGWVFNSPYLHRAHHSSQPKFRGKNLGGALMVWDRLFGTLEPDCDDATDFGIGRAPTPLNPLRANFEPLRQWWNRRRPVRA